MTAIRRWLWGLGLVIGLIGLPARAQAPPPVEVDLDYALFALNDGRTEVELYLAFEARSLQFAADSAGYRAPVTLDAAVATREGVPVWQETSEVVFLAPDTSALKGGQYFVHVLRAVVSPGTYALAISVRNERRLAQVRQPLPVRGFGDVGTTMSDVTLATTIRAGEGGDEALVRDGLLIRPNPRQLFGSGLSRLFYYAEIYDLDQIGTTSYTVRALVSQAGRTQPIANLLRETEHEVKPSDRIVGAFDLEAVPNGSYELHLLVLAGDSVAAEQARKFFVYNPTVERTEPTAAALTYETSEYALMSDAEVEAALEHLQTLASNREWRRARNIQDSEEQRRFLMEFWRLRDPNPATYVNEFKEEFYRRLQFATDRYGDGMREGWKTERGRVFLKYGEPSNIRSNLYDSNQYPHEIWEYDYIQGEGQGLFVFMDRDGFGSFRLIHSNVAGEPKSNNWQMELVR